MDKSMINKDIVEWIVNDIGELGVKIGEQFFFLYKGHSLVYEDGKHDNGQPMHWRPVFKREFGECCHPINYDDPRKIGTVSLDDSDDWQELLDAPDGNVNGGMFNYFYRTEWIELPDNDVALAISKDSTGILTSDKRIDGKEFLEVEKMLRDEAANHAQKSISNFQIMALSLV